MKLIIILLFLLSFITGNAQLKERVDSKYLNSSYISFSSEMDNIVSFTLANTTDKSIPLIIPNVMNPNLSPNSESGVTLRFGQEILFKYKGKKRILLTVDDSIKGGEVIDVAALLKERKKDIDFSK